jgi:hypothetical protein
MKKIVLVLLAMVMLGGCTLQKKEINIQLSKAKLG